MEGSGLTQQFNTSKMIPPSDFLKSFYLEALCTQSQMPLSTTNGNRLIHLSLENKVLEMTVLQRWGQISPLPWLVLP